MKEVKVLVTWSCPTLCDPMECSQPGSSDFPDKNTGVGSYYLLQGIFPTQGSNPVSPASQADSLPSEASATTFWACCL